ncbi:septal ring lytic transglycosylase RlpA family protein [Massilia sp. RP-1-19]|uniref:Endolytic peptidoglycan transglycosylase RlpA n=1 Tax=Massilia polaris TaxID=2728846 RepID=A0A848HMW0_9BURK|nr:septal ring lytic transglycosylase RlpA family protein [Massilia polaris]NML63246.1 septal ring lytic transglycosylase RlpA family protein [Massilia polaris]
MAPALARLSLALLALVLAGCGSTSGGKQRSLWPFPTPLHKAERHPSVDPDMPLLPAAGSGRGGYYKDDGPGDNPPSNLKDVADAEVRAEPYSKYANRSYTVFGKTYVPIVNEEAFVQRGVSSWYGKKFHGQRTSSGELYDMYKMTAAHPTLPIPSYARVTNISSGKQVVVRINDRGPFHAGRVIDVSFTAALKLGLLGKGSHEVEVERLLPDGVINVAAQRRNAPQTANAFYLQLGAYTLAEKAEQARARLRNRAAVRGALEVVKGGSMHRLFSGPFASRDEANEAMRELKAMGLNPMVVRR